MIAPAAVVAALLAALLLAADQAPAPDWREVPWPYPRDAWPPGRAFRCITPGCNGLLVTIRPKLGFCNCTTGVTTDAEVDAVTDLDMTTEDFVPTAPGQPATLANLHGRTRPYTLNLPDGTTRPATGTALSSRCDLLVAATQGPTANPQAAHQALAALLATRPLATWLEARLNGS